MTREEIIQGDLKMQNITINGVEYAPVAARPAGTRAVVVVDRGWIFCGDVTREHGRIRLSRAVHVFSWESIGFAKMVETEKADLRPIADVDMPEGAEIFCVPVHDGWGL
jgi:hypothetical protein